MMKRSEGSPEASIITMTLPTGEGQKAGVPGLALGCKQCAQTCQKGLLRDPQLGRRSVKSSS